jgi:hypothetical protein
MSSIQLAASTPSAGGAAIDQVIIATVGAMLATGALLALGIGHRTGRFRLLGRAAEHSAWISGLPPWAALPSAVSAGALVIALFGMLWDISLHIDDGRDEGPLANPAHYFILVGLFGVFASGYLAMVLPEGRPSATAIRITRNWYAPLGGVLIGVCGSFSLIAFPLDDVWHRLFGQDVTLWGPTHLMLIGGAATTLVGVAVLLVEARRATAAAGANRERKWIMGVRGIALTGAFLLGLSTFQAEFDFGVPQFRFVFQPMLIMLAAGAGLVAARVWLGRGAAIGAALFFIGVRGVIALLVGPVLGETLPHFPLYLAEAVIVELVAIWIPPRRPVHFALASGALIGTVGLAAEWGWSQVFMPLPWPAELFPEAAVLGFAMAIAGSLVGAWIGARLGSDRISRTLGQRWAGALGAVAVAGLIGFGLLTRSDEGVSANVDLRDAGVSTAEATVTLDPPTAADDADWLHAISWQGGEELVLDELEPVGPGVYRTTEPLPVDGTWKTLLRLHEGDSLTLLPIYLTADPAIPAEGVRATDGVTRKFVVEREFLQREAKADPGPLSLAAYLTVVAITLAFLSLVAWGIHRLAVAAEAGGPQEGGSQKAASRRGRQSVVRPPSRADLTGNEKAAERVEG